MYERAAADATRQHAVLLPGGAFQNGEVVGNEKNKLFYGDTL